MKINHILIISLVSFFLFSGSSPKNNSPSKWSKADVKLFKNECLGVKEIQDLGKIGIQLCDCILDKSQQSYPSYSAANADEPGMKKIGESCAKEVTTAIYAPVKSSSSKGKWSKEDKKTFLDDCNGVKEIKDLGKLGKELCDCMLKKSEQTFQNFKDADSDVEGMEAIGTACGEEVGNRKK